MEPRKPILAYHVVFGAYGFWLPNDPRGSWSEEVWAEHLKAFGSATKVETRYSVAKRKHDYALRQRAKESLLYPAIRFTGLQALEIAKGFAEASRLSQATIWAAAIMPDHVHLIIARGTSKVETVAGYLKRFATRSLNNAKCHPFANMLDESGRTPSPWCGGIWKVFLHSEEEIERAIAYVENNPLQAGLRPQKWSFVTTFGT